MVGGGMLSGGIVFAVAALLWLVYLIPTWVRRHEYMATERNSVRLQQTLRILAETSELPEEVRLEATAREVAEQQKRLKRIEAERDAARKAESKAAIERAKAESEASAARAKSEARAAAAKARAEAAEARARAEAERVRANARTRMLRSRRRARLATTGIMTVSLVTAAVGGGAALSSGAWMLPAAATGTFILAVALIARMAKVSARVPVAAAAPVMSERRSTEVYDADLVADAAPAAVGWTPTPLPKPLYLSQGSSAAAIIAASEAQRRLREAAMAEAMSQKAVELQPQAPSIAVRRAEHEHRRAVQERAEASPYAAMGVVDEGEIMAADLVRRRRAVG